MRLFLRHSTKVGCDFEILEYDAAAHTARVRTPEGDEHFDHAFHPHILKAVGYILTSDVPKSFAGKDHAQ